MTVKKKQEVSGEGKEKEGDTGWRNQVSIHTEPLLQAQEKKKKGQSFLQYQ